MDHPSDTVDPARLSLDYDHGELCLSNLELRPYSTINDQTQEEDQFAAHDTLNPACPCNICFEKSAPTFDYRSATNIGVETARNSFPTFEMIPGEVHPSPGVPSQNLFFLDMGNTVPVLVTSNEKGKRKASSPGIPVEDIRNAIYRLNTIQQDPAARSQALRETILDLESLIQNGHGGGPRKSLKCCPATLTSYGRRSDISMEPLSSICGGNCNLDIDFHSPPQNIISLLDSPKNDVHNERTYNFSETVQANDTIYHCTHAHCSSAFNDATDWRRHEEGVHWKTTMYMCLLCDDGINDLEGNLRCFCCSTIMPDIGVLRTHYLNCEDARRARPVWPRKDKLIDHLRKKHSDDWQQFGSQTSEWKYNLHSDWPRECGFCGVLFTEWKPRAGHVGHHFLKGSKISQWRMPFPGPKDAAAVPDIRPRDDESDNDDGDGDSDDSNGDHHKASGERDHTKVTSNKRPANNSARTSNDTTHDCHTMFHVDEKCLTKGLLGLSLAEPAQYPDVTPPPRVIESDEAPLEIQAREPLTEDESKNTMPNPEDLGELSSFHKRPQLSCRRSIGSFLTYPSSVMSADSSTSFQRSFFNQSYAGSVASDFSSSPSVPASQNVQLPAQVTLNHLLSTMPFNYGYDLPCEFAFLGCSIRHHPTGLEEWIAHSLSHFSTLPPPQESICIVCDDMFRSHGNPISAWRDRMMHIEGHYKNLEFEIRPDFFVIEYMGQNNLISAEDLSFLMEYSERPSCGNLVPLGAQNNEMSLRKERKDWTYHNLCKERRALKILSKPSYNKRPADQMKSLEKIGKGSQTRTEKSSRKMFESTSKDLIHIQTHDTITLSTVNASSDSLDAGLNIEGKIIKNDGRPTSFGDSDVTALINEGSSTRSSSKSSRDYDSSLFSLPNISRPSSLASSNSCILRTQDSGIDGRLFSRTSLSRRGGNTNSGGSDQLYSTSDRTEQKYRVPDNSNKYIKSTIRQSVEVINHRACISDPYAPRSSDATSSHYREALRGSNYYSRDKPRRHRPGS